MVAFVGVGVLNVGSPSSTRTPGRLGTLGAPGIGGRILGFGAIGGGIACDGVRICARGTGAACAGATGAAATGLGVGDDGTDEGGVGDAGRTTAGSRIGPCTEMCETFATGCVGASDEGPVFRATGGTAGANFGAGAAARTGVAIGTCRGGVTGAGAETAAGAGFGGSMASGGAAGFCATTTGGLATGASTGGTAMRPGVLNSSS